MSSKLDRKHAEEMAQLKRLQARRTKSNSKKRPRVQADIDEFFLGNGGGKRRN